MSLSLNLLCGITERGEEEKQKIKVKILENEQAFMGI